MTRNRYLIYVLLLVIVSCEEAVDWDFKPGENNQLVVDAILTDELKVQEIKLSLSFDRLNDEAMPVSGAEVQVISGVQTVVFQEDNDVPGLYLSEQAFAAELEIQYRLEILWDGESYEAENEMVPVLPLSPIIYNT